MRRLRASVACRLVCGAHVPPMLVDLSALAAFVDGKRYAFQSSNALHPDARNYSLLKAHIHLVSLATSNLHAMLVSERGDALYALVKLLRGIWLLSRSIQDHRESYLERSAVKVMLQRLHLRLWYEARSFVEDQRGEERATLRELIKSTNEPDW